MSETLRGRIERIVRSGKFDDEMAADTTTEILQAFRESLPEENPGSYEWEDVDAFNAGHEECRKELLRRLCE